MIVVTGAAGFIGANVVAALNDRGRADVVAVDYFDQPDPPQPMPRDPSYLDEMQVARRIDARELPGFLASDGGNVESIIHMGACSDTFQTDRPFMMANNLEYTRTLWRWCTENARSYVYASSAATYGDGAHGYDDTIDPSVYAPLNVYGESKQLFDLWAIEQTCVPPRWAGLKFFNVYGPRESHKQRMASVAFHSYNQIRETGRVKLFQSHRPDYPHGGQKRDFVFVADAVAVALHFLDTPASASAPNGLYNTGTGQARTFEQLARAVFAAMDLEPNIEFIPMPEYLRDKYQYFTQAALGKLREAGFAAEIHSIESGAREYVQYLQARQ